MPALEGLWRRFAGFGVAAPLVEQRAVLDELARLHGEAARAALRRVVVSPCLPASLLPRALRAAAQAGLAVPAAFVAPLLGHADAAAREAAFALALKAGGARRPAAARAERCVGFCPAVGGHRHGPAGRRPAYGTSPARRGRGWSLRGCQPPGARAAARTAGRRPAYGTSPARRGPDVPAEGSFAKAIVLDERGHPAGSASFSLRT